MTTIMRGVRNNNPGNVRKNGQRWKGMRETQTDAEFLQFKEMKWGIRALIVNLRTYVTRRGCTTVSKIINRWAPRKDHNNTDAYIKACAVAVGKCLTNSSDIRLQTKLGLEFQFSADDFNMHVLTKTPKVLYELVAKMCWIESNYKLEYGLFYDAIEML